MLVVGSWHLAALSTQKLTRFLQIRNCTSKGLAKEIPHGDLMLLLFSPQCSDERVLIPDTNLFMLT